LGAASGVQGAAAAAAAAVSGALITLLITNGMDPRLVEVTEAAESGNY